MSCRTLFTAILILISLVSCSRRSTGAVERLAVLPLQNLSDDAELDWVGPAAAAAIAYDLAGARDLFCQRVDSIAGAHAARASRIAEGYFFVRDGRIEARVTIEDLVRTRTLSSFEVSGPLSDGFPAMVNHVARRISASARPYATNSAQAFRRYGEALRSADLPGALRALQSAKEADPRFTAAYLERARALAAAGDRDGALIEIRAALAQSPNAIDATQLEVLQATLVNDREARMGALERLAKLTPADEAVLTDLAQEQFAQRRFAEAVHTYEGATRIGNEAPAAWNELGYAYGFVHDLESARRALAHYQQLLTPPDVNGLDSLGEVSFYMGDFSGAARSFVQAQERNPGALGGGELLKAAQAQLLSGDSGAADRLFERYVAERQPPQKEWAGYHRAQWEFLTGRRKSALDRLDRIIPTLDGDLGALASGQLWRWKLETGDSKDVAELSARVAHSENPQLRELGVHLRAIASGGAVKSGSALMDAYALLFAGKLGEAVPQLEKLYRQTNPSFDGQVRTLLAWAYVRAGRVADAAKLVDRYPIPLFSGDPLFASLIFPRFLLVRGLALRSQGKRAEAARSLELYRKYAGDVPDVFGDKKLLAGL